LAVKRDRFERSFFSAENIAGLGSIAAVGRGIDHELSRTTQAIYEPDGFQIDGAGKRGVAIASRRPDERGQRYHSVRFCNKLFHQKLIPHIAVNKIKVPTVAEVKKTVLLIQEVVYDSGMIPCIDQALA
jgi:hypothetical protein